MRILGLISTCALLACTQATTPETLGEPGPQGPAGESGPQGPAGEPGPAGLAGPTGAAGATALVRTRVLPAGSTCPTGGVAVEVGVDQDNNGLLDDAEVSTAQTQTVCNGAVGVAGAEGATGPQGPIGLTGASGAQGLVGPTGDTGATGAQGPVGPTGATGSNGPMGATGAQGPVGPQGPAGTPFIAAEDRPTPAEVSTLTLTASAITKLGLRRFRIDTEMEEVGQQVRANPPVLEVTLSSSIALAELLDLQHQGQAFSFSLWWSSSFALSSTEAYLESVRVVAPRNATQVDTIEARFRLGELTVTSLGVANSSWNFVANTAGSKSGCETDLFSHAWATTADPSNLVAGEQLATSWATETTTPVILPSLPGSAWPEPIALTAPAPTNAVCLLERMCSGAAITTLSLRSYWAAGINKVVVEQVQSPRSYLTGLSWEGSGSGAVTLGATYAPTSLRWLTRSLSSTQTSTWGWDYVLQVRIP